MNCPDKGYMQAWIDGELVEAEKRAFDSHLQRCEVCRAAVESVRENRTAIMNRVQELDPPPVAIPSFETASGSAAKAHRPNSAGASPPMVVSGRFLRVAAAAVIFLTIGFVGTLTQFGGDQPPDDSALFLTEAEPVILNPNRSWHNRELFVSVVSTDSAFGATPVVTERETDKLSAP
jgi:anti-sigma factor RsiW